MNFFKNLALGTGLIFSLALGGFTQAQSIQPFKNNSSVKWNNCRGMGMGGGQFYGGGPKRNFDRGFYRTQGGSALMTQEEFMNHRDKIFSSKSYNDCKTIQSNQHNTMLDRAKVQGITLPATPRQNICDRLNDSGYFN